MNILTLFSSARPKGNTYELLQHIHSFCQMNIIHLDELDIRDYDYQIIHKDAFIPLIDKMLEADKIIIASPVYWYSVTPKLKAFIDRFTDLLENESLKLKGKALREKTFYIASTSGHPEAPSAFIDMLKGTLDYLGYPLKGMIHANCKQGYNKQQESSKVQAFAQIIDGSRNEHSWQKELSHILEGVNHLR